MSGQLLTASDSLCHTDLLLQSLQVSRLRDGAVD